MEVTEKGREVEDMLRLKGRYNEAVVFTDKLEPQTEAQIIDLLDRKDFAENKIRIMPDVHMGKGCVIGLSMDLLDRIAPNLVGVDIGCGVLTLVLRERRLDPAELDRTIRHHVPSGFSIHRDAGEGRQELAREIGIDKVKARVDRDRAVKSLGTLGGGNHFIELGRSVSGELYLFVHSGSRHFGFQIANHHQKKAAEKTHAKGADRDLACLEGKDLSDYLSDMAVAQRYAAENRRRIARAILDRMGLSVQEEFDTVHNYIDMKDRIVRKGAVRAHKGEKIVIPLNMKDGTIIAEGKGAPEWNMTAPHGAGRLYSRREAKRILSLKEFTESMADIYTTSVGKKTIDEAPMAYKKKEAILAHAEETVEVLEIVRPLYNFKA